VALSRSSESARLIPASARALEHIAHSHHFTAFGGNQLAILFSTQCATMPDQYNTRSFSAFQQGIANYVKSTDGKNSHVLVTFKILKLTSRDFINILIVK